jgi:tripartite-type tricarboxylate transporter receptor subunit TctC
MKLPLRQFLHLAAGAAALPVVSRIARAQAYPSRPVRIVVGFPAGGNTDIIARLIGQWLSERLGQPFIVENRPGAGSTIGADVVAKAAPDGYTLLLLSSSTFISGTLYNFDVVRDIAPVGTVTRGAYVMLVNPSNPARSVPEFIAFAKAHSGKVTMASAGTGSGGHVTGELFRTMTGVDMLHVPYRGDPAALTDLMGGRVDLYFSTVPPSIEYIRTGKLRALAVTTAQRVEALREIPAVGELVPGFESSLWNGFGAPKGMSTEIVGKLNKEVNAAIADRGIQTRLAALGVTGHGSTPDGFGRLIAEETEKWGKVIRTANIKPG